jgi:hypothetical protein
MAYEDARMICGLDHIQLACITVLAARNGPLDSIEIAARVGEIKPNPLSIYVGTAEQVSAIRRSLGYLADMGLICDMGRGPRAGRRHWATPDVARRSVVQDHAVYRRRASHSVASKSRTSFCMRGH